MNHRVTSAFHFSYGHRLQFHNGGCREIHGHNGILEVTVGGPIFDLVTGMIVDFGELKKIIGGDWLSNTWDHTLLLQKSDPLAKHLADFAPPNPKGVEPSFWFPKICLFDLPPTAEVMAKEACRCIDELLPRGLYVEHVVMRETERCWASYKANT